MGLKKTFPHYRQPDAKDCGPTCLRIIAKHYGKQLSMQQIRHLSETTREGSSLKGLSEAAESLGFKTLGVKINLQMLIEDAPLPCILHWNKNHFVVLFNMKKPLSFRGWGDLIALSTTSQKVLLAAQTTD